jgi:ACS family D-galactonate transporter-like MFS transporter
MTARVRGQWILLSLLVISVTINYIDRGTLSIAASRLSSELSLDPEKIGLLLSSFFWTYAAMQIVAGWLIDRYSVYWIFAGGFFIWSAATALTGLAGGFATILALRLLLGVGESVAYPAYSKIIAQGFTERHRGLANGLIDAGCKAGPALGLMIGGVIISRYGWRPLFVGIGLISMLWLIPWFWVTIRASRPSEHSVTHSGLEAGPGMLEIAQQRSAWGTFLCLFCGNYVWYFLLTWLPWYLVRERHYSEAAMGRFGSMAFWAVGLASLLSGVVSDRLVQGGGSPTLVRKSFAAGGLIGAIVMVFVPMLESQSASLAVLIFACISFGCYSSHPWLIGQTLAGPAAAGRWSGMQNAVGNLAGVIAPWLTGRIVRDTGHFVYAFAVVGVILGLGAASYLLIIGRIEPIVWRPKILSANG